jgi:hypothetical protein
MTNHNSMKRRIALTLVAGALALACTVRAEQSGAGHYISGMFSDFSTSLPSAEGWSFLNFGLCYDNARAGGTRGLPFGGQIAANIKVQEYAEIPAILYAPPFQILGGQPSVGVALPYVWLQVRALGDITTRLGDRSPGRTDWASGFSDLVLLPCNLGWTNGDFRYGMAPLIFAPTGEYNQGELANVGLGYWTFTPMVTFSWLSSKIGTEFSIFTGVDFNTKNNTADYQSGDIWHVDATLAQHLPLAGGFAGVGATAFYLKQFTGDSGGGATLGAFEVQSYGVGPTVSYARKLGTTQAVLDVQWLPQIHTENTTKGNFIWVKLGLLF